MQDRSQHEPKYLYYIANMNLNEYEFLLKNFRRNILDKDNTLK